MLWESGEGQQLVFLWCNLIEDKLPSVKGELCVIFGNMDDEHQTELYYRMYAGVGEIKSYE